jgi:chromosome segregation ATPase
MIALALLMLTAPTGAQTPRSGAAETTRLQQMLQQVNADKAALARENGELKAKLQALEKEAGALKKERNQMSGRANLAESRAQRAEANHQAVDTSLDATRQRLQEVVGKYRELAENTRQIESDRNRANGELATSRRELESCQVANVDLAVIAEEALARYEEKGVFAALAQKDPFTGIQRARIENLVDAYRGRVEEKRITPGQN